MALLVLDEWLWSDAAGENGEERQRETMEFMHAVYVICDRLVIVRGSRFAEKAASFWKHTDTTRRQFARFFKEAILYNSAKAELVEASSLGTLPDGITRETQPEDRYLAQAQQAISGSTIITTDTGLKATLDRHGVPNAYRDAFVSQYLQAYWKRKS